MAIRRSTPRSGGRSTPKCIMGYISWDVFGSHLGLHWTPRVPESRDACNTNSPNLLGEPTLADGPLPQVTEKMMPWIPVSKHWQTDILWPVAPHSPLNGEGNLTLQGIDALNTSTQKLADEPTLADGPPVTRIDALNTATPNVADEPTLANATDIYWSWMVISHCYWHLLVQNGNFTLLLTSSGQEWQFHIASVI